MRTPPRRLRRWKATVALAATSSAALSGASAGAVLGAPAEAPGAPGAAATWTTGDKEGLGTSTTVESKLWYTLTGGTMSEVYYPSGTTPNTRELQFAVTDGRTSTQLESDDTVTRAVSLVDPQSLTYRQTSTDQQGRWRLTKTYVTDPARPTVLLDVRFEALTGDPYQLFALYDPSLAGDAGNDSGSTSGSALLSSDTHGSAGAVVSALMSSAPFSATTTGYVGTSDGRAELVANHTLSTMYASAGPGNIAQVGQIPATGASTTFTLALGFGSDTTSALTTANASLAQPFTAQLAAYQDGWHRYTKSLNRAPAKLDARLTAQYWASVMTLKAHEDKTYPGAFIASLTIPWGQAVNASGAGGAGNGYHFVWARDEYEQVTGLLAGRQERRPERGHLAVHPAAAARRPLPAELRAGRYARPDQHPAGRDGIPAHPGSAGGVGDQELLHRPHQEGRRLPRVTRSDDATGTVGGDRRILTVDHRGHDRRAHSRGLVGHQVR